jgi:acyl carrier protein
MTRNEIMEKITEVFRDVFEDENIVLTDETTAEDIDDWDSLTHITLICEIEKAFGFKFQMKDITGMKNVGEMADILGGGCS